MTEPSGSQKFLYYTLGITPPAVTRDWVELDVASTGFIVRRALQVLVGLVIGFSISAALIGGSGWTVLGGFIGGLIGAFLQATILADYVRRRTLSYYRKKWDRRLSV
jgi:hypothetical protein